MWWQAPSELHAQLRAFAAPVPDEELPELRHHTLTAARIVTGTMALLSVVYWLANLRVEGVDVVQLSLVGAGTFTGHLALHTWARLRPPMRRPEVPLLLATLLLILATISTGWTWTGEHGAITVFAPVIPLSVGAFVPWRPSHSVVLTAVAGALPLLTGTPLPVTTGAYAFAALSIAVMAGLSAQLQRRLRQRLSRTTRALSSAERMSGLGRMTAGIAHELKTPLATAGHELEGSRRLAEELQASIGHPEVTEQDLAEIARDLQQSTSVLGEALERANTFVRAVRNHTRMIDSDAQRFTVRERLTHVRTLLAHRLRRAGVQLDDTEVPPAAGTEGDVQRFDQVLTNLLSNALDAMEESGRGSTVRVSAHEGDQGLVLSVRDDGPGIPESIQERIFEPMFTTRQAPHGTGLGLAMARDIARASLGGDLRLVDGTDGAHFELTCRPGHSEPQSQQAWVPSFVSE
jgi:signal transduction histidine kinase